MGFIELRKVKQSPVFRKIAMGTWRTVGDPSTYALVQVDMSKALDFAQSYSEQNKVHVTPTHLVAKALIHCLKKRPEINGLIRGSRIYLRDHVSLFFQVNVQKAGVDSANLSGVTLHDVDDFSLKDIVKHLENKKDAVVNDRDPQFTSQMKIVQALPWWFVRFYLNIGSLLIYGLNLNLSWLGLPKDPFGSAMITNAGSLGVDFALAPLVPYSRVPLIVAMGAIRPTPWIENNSLCIRPVMPVSVTFDHRLVDGVHGAQMNKDFLQCFAEPEKFLQ